MAERYDNFNIGGNLTTGGKELTVVGWFEGGNSAFDSEVWMDADDGRSIFDRENYSSVLVRVTGPEPAKSLIGGRVRENAGEGAAKSLIARIESDKRLPLRALPETDYYAAQTMTAKPIRFLGDFLASAMSIGAIFAAMNTMYASLGARTREIGTLRVLGYSRRTILVSFLIEGAILALLGGIIGCALSFPMHGYSTGTMSFESFSEVVFQFRITPTLVAKGLVFSIVVGLVGSFLPALRASRLPVIAALKAV